MLPAMLENGHAAPDFELQADDGKPVRLSRLKNKLVVLYFYPKDDTPGCTTEAKDFSGLKAKFAVAGAEVFGISPDSAASHDKFRCKHDLSVRLLADPDHAIAGKFGVWVEKSMYGKTYMGVERATFLIGKNGKVAKIWRKVKVPGHAEEVLAAVKAHGL